MTDGQYEVLGVVEAKTENERRASLNKIRELNFPNPVLILDIVQNQSPSNLNS